MGAKLSDLTGRAFGRLTVVTRAADYVSPKGYRNVRWSCRCECGAEVVRRADHLRSGKTTSCGCYRSELGWQEQGIEVGYHAAHRRNRRYRGPASEHACVDCGNQAYEWSYVPTCPDERVEHGSPYCPRGREHPECYVARCTPCHRRFDLRKEAA